MSRYEISTCKRSTFLRSNVGKNKSLEAKCLQLRSALENGLTERLKGRGKDKELNNSVYFDGNTDNTSESNTSAISSLSSQLTPLVDKTYIEVEQSIEIKNINISRTLETPITEADSTTTMSNSGLHMTYNSRTYTGNIKFSPTKEASHEVSTSITPDGISHLDSNTSIDPSCLHDDEVSVNLKPVSMKHEIKDWSPGSEFENTISILTRNQLKAICKDDVLPIKEENKLSSSNGIKNKEKEMEIDALTKEIMEKRFSKYFDWKQNICSLCNKRFKGVNVHNMYQHILLHTGWKRYECLFNGCTFQTFSKKPLQVHVQNHSKEFNGKSLDSLVGLIDRNRWNLRLIKMPKPVVQPKKVTKVVKLNRKNDVASKKLVKSMNRPSKKTVKPVKSEKNKIKPNPNVQNGVRRKIMVTTILKNKNNTKQKLLTDFKSFTGINRLKTVSQKRNTQEESTSAKRKNLKKSVENIAPKRIKSSPVQNGILKKEASPSGKTVLKRRTPVNSPDHRKRSVMKREIKGEEIIVNHLTLAQESNSEPLNSAHIIDSSSLEEEESQESDRPVDDSHLKKIFMEVIFGSTPSPPVLSPGRPVRNKSRPKRDSDFILGSQKESDKDSQEVKITLNKKVAKSSDSKFNSEGSPSTRKAK